MKWKKSGCYFYRYDGFTMIHIRRRGKRNDVFVQQPNGKWNLTSEFIGTFCSLQRAMNWSMNWQKKHRFVDVRPLKEIWISEKWENGLLIGYRCH